MKARHLLSLLTLAAHGCGDDGPPVVLDVPSDAPAAISWTADDLESDLTRAGANMVERRSTTSCVSGEVQIVFGGIDASLSKQTLVIDHERCDDGHRFELSGGSLLAAQWAAYDLMRELGVRYFHPEQTYHPRELRWPDADLSREEAPDFRARVLGTHRTHPIELSGPLEDGVAPMEQLQKNWIDWNVKLKQNQVNGFDESIVGTHAYDRGFPRRTGFNLLNSQQGGRPILDPDDPRTEAQQIAEAIDERMSPVDGFPVPEIFSTQFNPSEFTEADDQVTVERLTAFSSHLSRNYPNVEQLTNNHGTAGSTTAHYGVRFFDLSQFAPAELGVQIHTLMFYGLDRAAPVYGNEDFEYLLDFAERESAKRRIHHFPEGSWWLTFDLPVPLYLAPVTIEARDRDIELLRPLLSPSDESETGVYGHRLFTSGQEWGYWTIDWCTALMTWDADFGQEGCWGRLTGIFENGTRVREILEAVAADQAVHMRDPEIIRYLVGSDRETELAFDAGIVFHPLPPGPGAVLSWSDEDVAALERDSLQPLRGIAKRYHDWADELEAILEEQSERARPWLEEIRDGLRVYALRAEHGLAVYETALELRAAIDSGSLEQLSASAAGLDEARALTESARDVVRRREAAYRYPEVLTIAGDEPGTAGAVPNQTIYPYRYLSRTHRMFYWERPNAQLEELFGGGVDIVRVPTRILPADATFEISLLEAPRSGVRLEFSDGVVQEDLSARTFESHGFVEWSLDATLSTGVLHYEDVVAVVDRRYTFAKGSLEVLEPRGADVLDGLLPGFAVGIGDDGDPFLVVGRIDDRGDTASAGTLTRRSRQGLSSPAADWTLDIPDVGPVPIRSAEIEVVEGSPARMQIRGILETQAIIDLLLGVGGFEAEGARTIVAETLGYSPETLPEELPFFVAATAR